MTDKRKSAPDTAISEGAKANKHDYNTAPGGECKELTLEDLENSDLYDDIFVAFLELDAAFYLADEIQEDFFEKLKPGKDDKMIIWQFERYRALMWALNSKVNSAYGALRDIGLSRH